jgi:hypothetical protein
LEGFSDVAADGGVVDAFARAVGLSDEYPADGYGASGQGGADVEDEEDWERGRSILRVG